MQVSQFNQLAGWEALGGSFVFELPAMTVNQFVSRSGPVLIALPSDLGGYDVSDRSTSCHVHCRDLEAMRVYANERETDILSARSADMVRELGLDPDQWTFRSCDRFIFLESVGSPKVRLERHSESRWAVVLEGIAVGFASTPAKAYAILSR